MAEQAPYFLERRLVVPGRGRRGTVEAYGRPYSPEFGAFPSPRLDRIGAPTVETTTAAAAFPLSQICEARIAVGANQRTTRSFGPLVGPAIVDSATVDIQSVAGAFTQALDIGWADQDVEESLVATSSGRPWNSFFKRLPVQGTDLSANIAGEFSSSDLTQVIRYAKPIKGIVNRPSWWLVVSVMSDSATGIDMAVMVLVLQGVSPNALANFL